MTVVAPERPRSASGHAITLHKPLRAEKVRMPWGGEGYRHQRHAQRLRGAGHLRADAALRPGGLRHQPGAEPGRGPDLFRHRLRRHGRAPSAASPPSRCRWRITSIPITARPRASPPGSRDRCWSTACPPDILLNVNVPNLPEEEIAGVAITHQGKRRYEGRVERRAGPARPPLLLAGRRNHRRHRRRRQRRRRGPPGQNLHHPAAPGPDQLLLRGDDADMGAESIGDCPLPPCVCDGGDDRQTVNENRDCPRRKTGTVALTGTVPTLQWP